MIDNKFVEFNSKTDGSISILLSEIVVIEEYPYDDVNATKIRLRNGDWYLVHEEYNQVMQTINKAIEEKKLEKS